MRRPRKSRAAANHFLVSTIAAGWKVSTAAVLAAAALRGIKVTGEIVVVKDAVINGNIDFHNEAQFQQRMLDSAAERRLAA